jgi:hypothetical protein
LNVTKSKRPLVFISVLMAFLVGCNFFTSLGTSDGSGGTSTPVGSAVQPKAPTQPAVSAAPPTPPALAKPPAPVVYPGSPEEQAAKLAQGLAAAPDNTSRVAAWLGVYESVGIPVIDEAGTALTKTGDDPVGAPYWAVWYASGLDRPLRGMPLADAAKILTALPDGTSDAAAGKTLLADLRLGAQSKDLQVRRLAWFVRERMITGSTGQDMLLAEASPDALRIDPATVQLLHFALVRTTLYGIAQASPQSSAGQPVSVSFDLQPAARLVAAGKPRCAEMFGSEDTTAAVNWLANKFYSGVSIPGIGGMPGMTETVLKQVGVSVGKIQKINTFMQRANAIGALFSLYMQIQSLQIDGTMDSGGPLIRTKTTSDGKRDSITWHLFYDKDKTPDGNELWACMTNFISNAFGVTLSIPPKEGVAGADIIFAPGENIPEKVLFDSDTPNYRITTDANGQAKLKLIGKAQKKTLPDSAPPYNENFTIEVSAQPEAVTGSSLVNMFVDSIGLFVVPSAAAAVAPLVDLLKTLHYDLGEKGFLLTDWRVGYSAAGGQGIDIAGTICGPLTEPFHLDGAVADGSNVNFTYQPANEKGGAYTYTGSGGGVSFTGSGTYTIKEAKSGFDLILTQTDTRGCVGGVQGGCKEYVNTVTLTPLDSCKP